MATYAGYDFNRIRNPEIRTLLEKIMDVATGHDHDGENSALVTIEGGTVADGAIGTSKIADAAVTLAKIASTAFTADEAGRAKFANSFVNAALIANDAVETAKIKNDAVTLDKLADLARGSIIVGGASDAPTALDAKGDGNILIGDGTDLKSVTVSGDVTITNAGVTAIGAKKVTTAMLADNASANCKAIADPGTGEAIPVTGSGYVEIAIGDAAQTNTLAVPTFVGQELTIYAVSRAGSGTRTITVASAVNQTGNNTILLDAAGETVVLRAIKVGAALAWRVIVADGATLSTVA
jgi:hypothetical protein